MYRFQNYRRLVVAVAVLSVVASISGCDGDDAPVEELVDNVSGEDGPVIDDERMPDEPVPEIHGMEFGPEIVSVEEIPDRPVEMILAGSNHRVESVHIQKMHDMFLAQRDFGEGYFVEFKLARPGRITLTVPFSLIPARYEANAGTTQRDWNEADRAGPVLHGSTRPDRGEGDMESHAMSDAWSLAFEIESFDFDERSADGRVYLAYAGDEECEAGPSMLAGSFEASLDERIEFDW